MPQRINEQIWILPAIESELHFLQVRRQVLDADLVPRPDDAALQQTECGFDGVGVNLAAHVLTRTVVDRFVLALKLRQIEAVSRPFISHDHIDRFVHMGSNDVVQRSLGYIARSDKAQITAALADADHDFFILGPASRWPTMSLSADVGFIDFDRASQFRFAYFDHCGADAMAQIPRGFVAANFQRALKLIRGHSLACFHKKQHSHEPRFQRQMGIVEDRLRSHTELIAAFAAFKLRVVGQFKNLLAFAAQAFNAVGPAQFFQQCAALFVGRIQVREVIKCHGS